MQIIDAHQHFWVYEKEEHAWIGDDMHAIRRNFLPPDLKEVFAGNKVDGSVAVQVAQTEGENAFLLANAEAAGFIKGVVGWVDLQAQDLAGRLEYYRLFPKMKGFRHILQGEADRALMLRPSFLAGIGLLDRYGFTYDILIYPDQLPYALELARTLPGQRFVIDHLAKPPIREHRIDDWQKHMRGFASLDNVSCKISGMVTEAHWNNWKYEDFIPYLDVILETFGTKRILFGSDWPVCLVAATYEKMLGLMQRYFTAFSPGEQEDFFGRNATRFYNL